MTYILAFHLAVFKRSKIRKTNISSNKDLKFREYVSTLLDHRDHLHPILVTVEKNFGSSHIGSAYRNWFESQEYKWYLGEDVSTHATVRALGIREKFGKNLGAPWISLHFAHGQRLRLHVPIPVSENSCTLSKVPQVDLCDWGIS